ncbi:hypothetical protein SeMB42_g06739 [Synchytrium endobioticum]|uniref:Uncharacterized protein n=1 Tax=Synchytrium endobioticum TaxID=286115 RepID=A0A507CG59_9FUNG|nr:hypothetical protein SeMB42_g06739 [Synchytrium endobioticum]
MARYSSEYTFFRELLQNSNDANATEASIQFHTKNLVSLISDPTHPEISLNQLISRLRKRPPTLDNAVAVFKYLASQQHHFGFRDWAMICKSRFIPILLPNSDPPSWKYVQTSEVYFQQGGTKSEYADFFTFVDFGPAPNSFLAVAGVKNELTAAELCRQLVKAPHQFLSTLGTEKYLALLRKIAISFNALSSNGNLLRDMKTSPFLIALKGDLDSSYDERCRFKGRTRVKLLPGPYRWSIAPHTSFGDGYVTMSKKCLFDLLFDIPSFQKTVREMAGVGPKATKMATRAAFMKNPSKGRMLDEVFLLPPEMLAKSRYVLDDSPRRYVRTPSFKTNGLVLSLLWIDTTNKPPPADRKVEDAINLPNIFHNKTLRSTHKDAWAIALDPGATCITGAVAFDPNHPNPNGVTEIGWRLTSRKLSLQRNGSAPSPAGRLGPSSSNALSGHMTLRVRTTAPKSTRGSGGCRQSEKGRAR